MPQSVWSPAVTSVCDQAIDLRAAADAAKAAGTGAPPLPPPPKGGPPLTLIPGPQAAPFPSPEDWRDLWIYFLLVDRFDNPAAPPLLLPYDGEHGTFQGGTFEGVRQRLPYLKGLGVGAIWLSPVLKNCQYRDDTYHGYGLQDFLAVEPRFTRDPAASRADPSVADQELRALVDEAHAQGIYVILDIVLHHAGDVFDYDGFGSTAPLQDAPYPIHWRDASGAPAYPDIAAVTGLAPDAGVWPVELQHNAYFTRRGEGGESGGDFVQLKECATGFTVTSDLGDARPVQNILIRAYQYVMAKFDVDGYRIDTLKYVDPAFARDFGNAMREFALTIGKRNFFTFGEIYDDDEKIAQFIGRNAVLEGQPIGVDAALDFPLFFELPSVAKGFAPPSGLASLYAHRADVQKGLLTSHGEAAGYFVTFLDNHDQHQRFYFDDGAGRYDDQLTLAVGCLFSLLGIPCLYYGTEQGLHGRGDADSAVREALWGKPGAFDATHPFYVAIQRLSRVRAEQPPLRYGRLYFRPVSGDGKTFGISSTPSGVVAFSRLLGYLELVVVANTDAGQPWKGEVLVDAVLNAEGAAYEVLFSNKASPAAPGAVVAHARGAVSVVGADGSTSPGPVRALPVTLGPSEVQILGRKA
jgi:glycosidase